MTDAPAKQGNNGIAALLDGAGRREIAKALSDPEKAERFARIAMTTLRKSQQLMRCDPASIMSALMHCASFDMEPDARGLVWLVPYKSECQFQLGYKGMIELALRSGMVKSIFAEVVYRAEAEAGLFHFQGGTRRSITHDRDILRPELRQGEIIAAYAVAEMSNGTVVSELIDRAYIDKRKNASQGAKSSYSPWTQWEEEMIKKTAIKALCKTLPQSVEKLHMAIALEDEQDSKHVVIDTTATEASKLEKLVMGETVLPEQDKKVTCPITGEEQSATLCESCEEKGSCKEYAKNDK